MSISTKSLMAAAAVAIAALAACPYPALAYFESGKSLTEKLRACDKLEGGQFAAKEMYLCARGMGFVSALYDAAVDKGCSPDGITQGEVVTTVRKALDANQGAGDDAAYALSLDAIRKAYPCPARN